MDFNDPTSLLTSLFIGAVGFGFFMHGKKAGNLKTLLIGLLMMIFPNFISSVWLDLALAGGCIAAAAFLPAVG